MANALTTKARIKERIGITVTNWDDFIDRLILSVTKRMENMCSREFTLDTYTNELHDGSDFQASGRFNLITRNAPISTITKIEYKQGLNINPTWVEFSENDYDVDETAGIITFKYLLPRGQRNIRITYAAGWDGYDIAVTGLWKFNVTPTGTVNGSNRTFTLPEEASEVIVYVDGTRELASNVTFTSGGTSFTLAAGRAPYSSIAVDYKSTAADSGSDPTLPEDLVDVCERAVIHLFKKRESEGRSQESFQESSITWQGSVFDAEMLRTIKNYRRGYNI